MRGLPGNRGRGYRKFFDALSKKHDIDWAKMPKGSILVMTSETYHKVNPISSGKRYSLVIWSRGPKFR